MTGERRELQGSGIRPDAPGPLADISDAPAPGRGVSTWRRLVQAIRLAWSGPLEVDRITMIRRIVVADHAGMSHNVVARELTERYLALLGADWRSRPHEPLETFRRRLGLDPRVVAHSRPAPLHSVPTDRGEK